MKGHRCETRVRLTEGSFEINKFSIRIKMDALVVRFVPLVIDHNPGYKS